MQDKAFNVKVKVEKLEKVLAEDHTWKTNYVPWKEVWASIQLKDITITKGHYLFAIKWKGDFPVEFRVIFRNTVFTPTQQVVVDFKNEVLTFHATAKQSMR